MNNKKDSLLISPYGGELIDLLVAPEALTGLREAASRLPSLQLSDRCVCDLELLAVGAFSPLKGFMGSQDFQSVLDDMRLSDGHIFPIPVTLPVATAWGRQQYTQPLLVIDALIAATARVHGMTVVTRNVKDFELAGVQVLNPFAE